MTQHAILPDAIFRVNALIVAPIAARVGHLVCLTNSHGEGFLTAHDEQGEIVREQITDFEAARELYARLVYAGVITPITIPAHLRAPVSKKPRKRRAGGTVV